MRSTTSSGSALGLSFLIATTLGACSSQSGESTSSTGEAITPVCGASASGAVQGADVSVFQGNFGWGGRGLSFGYARIGDGVGYVDPSFEGNWSNMKANGVLRGAYQFFEPGEDEVAQANMMVGKVGRLQDGDLPAMIDVEVTGGQAPATIAAKVRHWLQIVEAGTGRRPLIYTGSYFWEGNVGDTSFGGYPLWIAAYGPTCPSLPNGWSNWLIWQYSDGGGSLDHDVFNGSLAALRGLGGPPDSSGCTPEETTNAGKFGCACVDHQASGGFCDGTGCSAIETSNAGKFGCACVDHQGNGGFCPGTGCTPRETEDAAKFGCACVDHRGNGGFCPGSGCTALETEDAAKFGCACVDHKANGGACAGTGCTAHETRECAGQGRVCSLHECK